MSLFPVTLVLALAVALPQDPGPLSPGQVEVHALSPHRFHVRAGLAWPPEGAAEGPSHAAYLPAGVEIGEVEATFQSSPVALQMERRGSLAAIHPPSVGAGGTGALQIRYQVDSPSGRLPVFAPLSSARGGAGVEIRLILAPGLRLEERSFPRFLRDGDEWLARLDAYPSAIMAGVGRQSDAPSLWTVRLVTNLGIALVLTFFLACALFLRHRARGASAAGGGAP